MTNSKIPRKARVTVAVPEPVAARKTKSSILATSAQVNPTSKVPAKAASKSAAAPVTAVAPGSAKPKPKLVRDSFTIPKSEYLVLEGLKVRATNLTRPVKKSELLRAGVAVLNAMTDKAFLAALNAVPSLKTGRPKGSDAASAPGKGTK